MKIEELPSNELIEMTADLYQEFCIEGKCIPMCHLKLTYIRIGDKFMLSTLKTAIKIGSGNFNSIESREVMLAEGSSPQEYENRSIELILKEEQRRKEGGGCFRINGKIVHYPKT